jgi:hypothetical protein
MLQLSRVHSENHSSHRERGKILLLGVAMFAGGLLGGTIAPDLNGSVALAAWMLFAVV